MALIKCPECASEVASETPECPGCGHPVNTGSREPKSPAVQKRQLLICLGILLVLLPFGVARDLPFVWGLSVICIPVAVAKLAAIGKAA
jgi:hypothetical protein